MTFFPSRHNAGSARGPRVILGAALAAFLLTGKGFAGGSGTRAAEFLKIGASGRQAAMGDAAVGLSDDAGGALSSPAAWGRLRRHEISLLRTQWLEGVNYTGLVYGHSTERCGNWGASLLWLDVPDIQGYDAAGGTARSPVEAGDRALLLGYGRSFGPLSLGANLKRVEQNLAGIKANAFAADLGAHWETSRSALGTLSLGFAVRNAGEEVRFIREGGRLPLSHDFGLGYSSRGDSLRLAADLSLAEGGTLRHRLGAEYWILNILALRTGLTPESDIGPGLSFGFGIRVRGIQLDYAFAGQGDLNNIHRLSLRCQFGKTRASRI